MKLAPTGSTGAPRCSHESTHTLQPEQSAQFLPTLPARRGTLGGAVMSAPNVTRPSTVATPKAYSYVRFSTPDQAAGDSDRRQTAMAAEYCARHGLTLDDKLTLRDLGVSAFKGKNRDTGALGAFLAALKAGDVAPGSVLLVENIDRLSRQGGMKAANLIDGIASAGVTVVELDSGMRYDAQSMAGLTGPLLAMVKGHLAHDESVKKSGRVSEAMAGKRERAEKTRETFTRTLPYWLRCDVVDGKRGAIEKHPTYAPIVERIFREYLAGRGKALIARGLNADKVPTPAPFDWLEETKRARAETWRPMAVGRTLANLAVTGANQQHRNVKDAPTRQREKVGEPVQGYYPRVISDEDFARCATLRASNRAKAGSPMRTPGRALAVTHILATLARCPLCGSSMTRVAKVNGAPARYMCSKALTGKHGACSRQYVPVADVERGLIAAADSLGQGAPGPDPAVSEELRALEAQHAGVLAKIAPLNAAVEALIDRIADVPSVMSARLAALEKERDTLAGELATLRGRSAASQPNVVKQRIAAMVGALKGYAPGDPLGYDAPYVNAQLFACFARVIVDYRTCELVMHWRHGPPPSVVRYSVKSLIEQQL